MDNNDRPKLKNVKINDYIHQQIKRVSLATGINVGHLVEMGVMKIVEDYNEGKFKSVETEFSKLRRDGTFSRV